MNKDFRIVRPTSRAAGKGFYFGKIIKLHDAAAFNGSADLKLETLGTELVGDALIINIQEIEAPAHSIVTPARKYFWGYSIGVNEQTGREVIILDPVAVGGGEVRNVPQFPMAW